MKVPLTLPQLGLTQTEGLVSEWLKKTGDPVKRDEIIFVVSTDKADVEIEAPADGIMGEIIVETGVTVPVGTPLAYLIVEGEDYDASTNLTPVKTESAAAFPSTPPQEAPAAIGAEDLPEKRKQKASPLARRIAAEGDVDLATVQGTGPGGRIVAADVRAASSLSSSRSAAKPQVSAAKPVLPFVDQRRRLLIAERMTESIRTIPSFTASLEVNASKLVDLYESLKEMSALTTKLTYTDFLLKGIALALQQTPMLNASWVENAPQVLEGIHLNFAVATDKGVAAPVIRDVDQLSLEQLAIARARLSEKSREGRLSLTEVENGPGTLSNLGMYRVDRFEGIITPGQCFIVSAGKLKHRPWVEDGVLGIQPTLDLTISVDHRIADGAQAASFLEKLAETIERPYMLLWGRDERSR